MSFTPSAEQFRLARTLLRMTQSGVSADTTIPQSVISRIENDLKVGTFWWKRPFGDHRLHLRQFYTERGVIFPSGGGSPIQANIKYLLSDLSGILRKREMQAAK